MSSKTAWWMSQNMLGADLEYHISFHIRIRPCHAISRAMGPPLHSRKRQWRHFSRGQSFESDLSDSLTTHQKEDNVGAYGRIDNAMNDEYFADNQDSAPYWRPRRSCPKVKFPFMRRMLLLSSKESKKMVEASVRTPNSEHFLFKIADPEPDAKTRRACYTANKVGDIQFQKISLTFFAELRSYNF